MSRRALTRISFQSKKSSFIRERTWLAWSRVVPSWQIPYRTASSTVECSVLGVGLYRFLRALKISFSSCVLLGAAMGRRHPGERDTRGIAAADRSGVQARARSVVGL